MYKDNTVGVVVPAYNEEGFVGSVIDSMPRFVDRIYVIDDCSTDGTWSEIQEHAEKVNARSWRSTDGGYEAVLGNNHTKTYATLDGRSEENRAFDRRVVPIQHDANRGVGGAIKTGYLHAIHDDIDITAVMGADGQMDPDYLDRIIDPVAEGIADYSKGNRLVSRDHLGGMSRWRLVGNTVLTFLTKIASGYWQMMDPQDGYTAISNDALHAVDIEDMYEYYGYCNDLLVKLNVNGFRVANVPRVGIYEDEQSHIRYSGYIPKVSGMLLRNFIWRLKVKYVVRDFHPLVLLYVFGAAITTSSVLLKVVSSVFHERSSINSDRYRWRDALTHFTIGTLSIIWAMVLDREENDGLSFQLDDDGDER